MTDTRQRRRPAPSLTNTGAVSAATTFDGALATACAMIVLLLPSVLPAAPPTLRPVAVESFFVAPDQPSRLRWDVAAGEAFDYVLRDYRQATVASGRAVATGQAIDVSVTLPPGFYEIEFPAAKQSFGVVSLPQFSGTADPFFCIDSALSWLVRDEALREGLLRVLHRSGIAMSRERLSWAQVNPADGSWQWETSMGYDRVRREHARQGVAVLDMCHDSPAWLGSVGKYPADLVRTAESWRTIAGKWRPTWGALEVWNEPDIFFGADLPADQYTALAKTLAYATAGQSPPLPLVGGVVAHHNRPFLDNAANCGLLDCVDVFSFHTYGRAPEMQGLVDSYRAWLKAHDRAAMPLWITECGRPWPKGPDRPPAEPDMISALDITMKAIEARCCGIERYFAFVYPFYEEQQQNFGMMGRLGTPLRSMAAYVRAALLLAGKTYLGDLVCDDASIQRARVFGDSRETVAVLYTGQPAAGAVARPGVPIVRAEGIDGRHVDLPGDGSVPVADGLVYLWLDRGRLGDRLATDTAAMRLWTLGQRKVEPRPSPSPIVLRLEADAARLQMKSDGHWLAADETPKGLPLRVRVFNLSDKPAALTLRLAASPPAARAVGSDVRSVTAPPTGFADADWKVDLSESFAADGRQELTVTAVAAGSAAGDGAAARLTGTVARLSIDLRAAQGPKGQ